MYIATIIPIARGIPFDVLTYYAPEDLAAGTVVTMPFGRQTIAGIVIESTTLAEAKTMIKAAAFSLKKISTIVGTIPLFAHAAESLRESSALSLVPTGAIAGAVMPNALFEYIAPEKMGDILATDIAPAVSAEDTIIGTTVERADQYKRLIRAAFADKKTVLFIAPTIRALETWRMALEKGIAKHIVTIHSKVTKRDLRAAYTTLRSHETPLVIFATPSSIVIPRKDLGHIIAEDESSSLYKTPDRYAFDTRTFIRQFALRAGIKLHWGDMLARFETLARTNRDHLPRTFIPDKLTVVPVEPYRSILPTEVIETIRHAQKKKQRIYIYASRKGVAPLSRCTDCGTIVTCPECELPMVLRNKVDAAGERSRTFMCTHCATTLPATHVCSYCGSWNITPVSIGTDSIRDAIALIVGDEAVFTIDDDVTPDAASLKQTLDAAEKQKSSVIIGTIKALPYIKHVHYCLFPFFDRLLSTPSLYTTEQTLRLVMECNERVGESVLVFTRQPDFPLIKQLETQKINAIVHDELELRKSLGYPPYGSIVKISITVPEGYRTRVSEQVTEMLEGIDHTQLPPRRVSAGSMKVLLVWILTVPTTYIEEDGPELSSFLAALHFPFVIEENPERL